MIGNTVIGLVLKDKTRSFPLSERVHDLNAIDLAIFLEIFGQQDAASRLSGRPQNQRIPKRKPVQPVEVNGGEDIADGRSSYIELGKYFDLPARNAGIDMQLSRDVYEILL